MISSRVAAEMLVRLSDTRAAIQQEIIDAGRSRGVGALMLIGSLGRGGGDAFSDLDLIAVPVEDGSPFDLGEVFAGRVLAELDKPRNAPAGGIYAGLCLDAGGLPLWVDLYQWPAATAAVPADGLALYDDIGLSASDVEFIPLLDRHRSGGPHRPVDADADLLLRVAVAAKYLSRGDFARLVRQLPAAAEVPPSVLATFLQGQLTGIMADHLAAAVVATTLLVEVAEACYVDRIATDRKSL